MADLPLSLTERKRLTQMIARWGAVDTYDRQRNFVENCGLDVISDRFRYGDTPGNFAQMLIRESQQAGMIGKPPEHALRMVLAYILEELVAGHPDEAHFIESLLHRQLERQSPPSPVAPTPRQPASTPPVTAKIPTSSPLVATPSSKTIPIRERSVPPPDDLPFFLLDGWWYGAALLLMVGGGIAGTLAAFLGQWLFTQITYQIHITAPWIVIAGVACGLLYAISGAINYPIDRWSYLSAIPGSYELLLDGYDLAERIAGLLTALPINLLIAWVFAHLMRAIIGGSLGLWALDQTQMLGLFFGIIGLGWVLRFFTET